MTSLISHMSYPTRFIYPTSTYSISTSLMNVLSEPLWGKPSVDLHAPEHLYYAAHLILLCPEFLSFRALKIILHFLCALMLLLISLMFIWFFFFLFRSFQNLLLCSTLFFFFFKYLFIWLHHVLIVADEIF